MARAAISTTIDRSVEDVFAVLSNLEDTPKWSSSALEAKMTSAGSVGVGATARYVDKFLGRASKHPSAKREVHRDQRRAASLCTPK